MQAGLYSQVDYNLADWHGSQYGFYFILCWFAITGLLIAATFRPEKSAEALQREQSRVEENLNEEKREELQPNALKPAEMV